MKFSYKLIQTLFEDSLPPPLELARQITMHAFEVDSVTRDEAGDRILDIKVLPNRAHDAFSYYGLAREVAAITRIPAKPVRIVALPAAPERPAPAITVAASSLVTRYRLLEIAGARVGESPAWLASALASHGQRSINLLVDLANYAMLMTGQPLHVFDADRVAGEIVVRESATGETIETLDSRMVELPAGTLIIADAHGPLAIAGVKGGKRAEVGGETRRVLLESATFVPGLVRRTARALGLRTDASLRFEHDLPPVLAERGMDCFISLLAGLVPPDTLTLSPVAEWYPHPVSPQEITLDCAWVNRLLGTALPREQMTRILELIGCEVVEHPRNRGNEGTLTVRPPADRPDLALPADYAEEIIRLTGLDAVGTRPLPPLPEVPAVNLRFYYTELLRERLVAQGFSELYLYSMVREGGEKAYELENPLSADRPYLRTALAPLFTERLAANAHVSELVGEADVRQFEIGSVFRDGKERVHAILGTTNKTLNLASCLPWPVENEYHGAVRVIEFDFDALIAGLPVPNSYADLAPLPVRTYAYKPFSPYPPVLRDIAVFLPAGESADALANLIRAEAGDLLVRLRLFDTFARGERTSYAYRLVFQSTDRTLTGEEVEQIMEKINRTIATRSGWQVR